MRIKGLLAIGLLVIATSTHGWDRGISDYGMTYTDRDEMQNLMDEQAWEYERRIQNLQNQVMELEIERQRKRKRPIEELIIEHELGYPLY